MRGEYQLSVLVGLILQFLSCPIINFGLFNGALIKWKDRGYPHFDPPKKINNDNFHDKTQAGNNEQRQTYRQGKLFVCSMKELIESRLTAFSGDLVFYRNEIK